MLSIEIFDQLAVSMFLCNVYSSMFFRFLISTSIAKQGYAADESDNEWDEFITRTYGEISVARPEPEVDLTVPRLDVNALLQQSFERWDELEANVAETEAARESVVDAEDEDDIVFDDDDIPWGDPDAMDKEAYARLQRLHEAATIPLFENSPMTSLEANIMILNMMRGNKSTNVSISNAFALFHRVILPQPNSLADSEYEASKQLMELGLEYESIDVCPNNCVLFRGEHKDKEVCPRRNCHAMRHKRHGNSWIPQKVLRRFPLVPRLTRIFQSPVHSASMTYHRRALVSRRDNLVRHMSQSQHMADIMAKFAEFCKDPRNLYLALSTDGMNPNSEKRSTYSMWPVLLLNYNVAAWFTTKPYFILLAMLIPGKKAVTGNQLDTFLEPLVEELQMLWMEGVMVRDAARWNNEHTFIMKAMLIFTIHDFPAYGMVAGCVTKGYNACPVCGPETESRRSRSLRKNVYEHQARRDLSPDHPWRRDTIQFRGQEEHRPPPLRVTGRQIMEWGAERQRWISNGGIEGDDDDPIHDHGVKRVSILYQLPYWKVRWHDANIIFNAIW